MFRWLVRSAFSVLGEGGIFVGHSRRARAGATGLLAFLLTFGFPPVAKTGLLVSGDQAVSDLAPYAERARREFNVPGLAVAVVKDGNVLFEQGFGQRNLEGGGAVDAHTLFCIASNTKSVTATAIEILADEGKLHLEDRVVDHLPWFRLSDPYATREIRVRDTLAHRSGLGSHAADLLFVPGTTYTTREVVERLRDMPLSSGFRAGFAYENVMYAVATLLIEQASGQSYADFVREHVLVRAGMTESRIDATELKPGDDVATAYAPGDDGRLRAIPPLAWKNNQGAAGIYSSVHDMAKWAVAQLAEGRLVSLESRQRMWSMITPIDIDAAPVPELETAQPNFLGYAEGWYVSDYGGQRLVWHTGEFPGVFSQVTLVPALHLGIVVMANQESDGIRDAVILHVLDHFLGRPSTDWIGAYAKVVKLEAAQLAAAVSKQDAGSPPSAKASRPLSSYVGTYRDAWYGDIEVSLMQGRLRIRFTKSPRLVGSLLAERPDTFMARWDDRSLDADAFIDFTADQGGRIAAATMRRASPRTAHAYDYQDLRLVRVGANQ
jgi:CubicO group peptidase (beta-lactamase class C family)